jgi:uncharacterized damage-inducible protein DinB
MEWSDARLWAALFESDIARSDEDIHGRFHHNHIVQHAFLRMWQGDADSTSFLDFDDAPSLMMYGQNSFEPAYMYLASQTEDTVSETMHLPESWLAVISEQLGQRREPSTIAETNLQVVLQTTHHRGQINARLRELGGAPPTVDYISWVWLGRPAAEWPEPTS